jgi:hypothetical protein
MLCILGTQPRLAADAAPERGDLHADVHLICRRERVANSWIRSSSGHQLRRALRLREEPCYRFSCSGNCNNTWQDGHQPVPALS